MKQRGHVLADVAFAEDEDLRAKLDPERRLAALADLSEGWLDGEGAREPPGDP